LSPSLNIQHNHDAGTEEYVSTTAVNTYIKVKKRTIQRS